MREGKERAQGSGPQPYSPGEPLSLPLQDSASLCRVSAYLSACLSVHARPVYIFRCLYTDGAAAPNGLLNTVAGHTLTCCLRAFGLVQTRLSPFEQQSLF